MMFLRLLEPLLNTQIEPTKCCPKCMTANNDAIYCRMCGARMIKAQTAQEKISVIQAIITKYQEKISLCQRNKHEGKFIKGFGCVDCYGFEALTTVEIKASVLRLN